MRDASPLLLIDTSGQRLGLVVLHDGRVHLVDEPVARGHAEILFDRIAQLLAEAGITYADLDRLAVTVGPGSFTGLRIGIAAARGLALALGIKAVGVPNLLGLSLAGEDHAALRIVHDARRNMAYVQDFSAPGIAASAPRLVPLEALGEDGDNLNVIENSVLDLVRVARFAARCAPEQFPPEPVYVRPADAKPQIKGRVARTGEGIL